MRMTLKDLHDVAVKSRSFVWNDLVDLIQRMCRLIVADVCKPGTVLVQGIDPRNRPGMRIVANKSTVAYYNAELNELCISLTAEWIEKWRNDWQAIYGVCLGLLCHEVGHFFYTDLVATKQCFMDLRENKAWTPRKPNASDEIIDRMENSIDKTITNRLFDLYNVMEDGYIERRLAKESRVSRIRNYIMYKTTHVNPMRYADEYLTMQLLPYSMARNILLRLSMYDCIAVENEEIWETDVMKAVAAAIPFFKAYYAEDDPIQRVGYVYDAYAALSVLLDEPEKDEDEDEREDDENHEEEPSKESDERNESSSSSPNGQDGQDEQNPSSGNGGESASNEESAEPDNGKGNRGGNEAPAQNGSHNESSNGEGTDSNEEIPDMIQPSKMDGRGAANRAGQQGNETPSDTVTSASNAEVTKEAGAIAQYDSNAADLDEQSERADDFVESDFKARRQEVMETKHGESTEECILKDHRNLSISDRLDPSFKNISIEITRPAVTEREREAYESIVKPNLQIARKIARYMEEVLTTKTASRNFKGYYCGKAVSPSAAAVRGQGPFCKKQKGTYEQSVFIGIVLDASNSMSGEKNRCAMRTCGILLAACESLHYPMLAIGHNADNSTPQANIYVYSDPDAVDGNDKYRIMTATPNNCNHDGVTLDYVYAAIRGRNEKTKIVFSICDGEPNGYEFGGDPARKYLHGMVENAKKRDRVQTIGVAVGCSNSMIKKLKTIYGETDFINASDLAKMPEQLMGVLKRTIIS